LRQVPWVHFVPRISTIWRRISCPEIREIPVKYREMKYVKYGDRIPIHQSFDKCGLDGLRGTDEKYPNENPLTA
jgi:hypothetical protein